MQPENEEAGDDDQRTDEAGNVIETHEHAEVSKDGKLHSHLSHFPLH
jgi:hypothetical protein